MRTNHRALFVGAIVLAMGTRGAEASFVTEMEPNNSIATAQNIDGFFSLDFSPDIGDVTGANTSTTIPHVTISGTGDGTFDYYSFFVPTAGAVGIFDIDYGWTGTAGNMDTELGLYTLAGGVLAANDDFSIVAGAGGSASSLGLDAFIQHTFASPGTYVIAVGQHQTVVATGGLTGSAPDPGDTYTLQVSIEGVPEPTSMALLGLASIGGLGLRWRQRRKAKDAPAAA